MKKIIIAVLAAVTALALVACGGGGNSGGGGAASGGSAGSGGSGGAPEPAGEVLTIKMATYDAETGGSTERIKIFQDKVVELSGGTIQFDFYSGGQLAAVFEEYAFLSSGAIDMCFFLPGPNTSNNPFVYGVEAAGEKSAARDCMLSLYFKDPTTSAIIDKYLEKDGIKIFGTEDDGGDVVVSAKGEVKSFDDLMVGTCGATRNAELYQSLGMNVVNVDLPDVYDSLQRGVCDFTFWTANSVIANRIYEVAPHGFITNDCGTDLVYACTRKLWDSLTEEQQGWMMEAAEYTQARSLELCDKYNAEFESYMETCNTGPAEDAWDFAIAMNQMDAPGMISIAESLYGEEGKADMIYLTLYKEAYLDHGQILGPEYDEYREQFGEITVTK